MSGYAGVLFGDIQNGKTVNVSNVHVTNSHIKGIRSVGSLVGFVSDGSTLNIDNCSSEGNTLTNYSVTNKSGYVGGLVGRSVREEHHDYRFLRNKAWSNMHR